MGVHKARIVFNPKVWEVIEWFTHNFDTEIGALGSVKLRTEDGEKYFYVEKLFFPKQEVTGTTVKFTPEMWGDLLKEHGLDGLKDIAFYWHRHPGSSAHSGTDDEDTFETFMSKEAGRRHFLFLQTAVGTDGWNEEARIDLRLPVRHTITHKDISLEVEETPEDKSLREECEEIAKKVIVKPEPVSYGRTYYQNGKWNQYNGYGRSSGSQKKLDFSSWENFKNSVQSLGKFKSFTEAVQEGRFGNFDEVDYMDNDFLDGFATGLSEKVSIKFENGQATIKAGVIYARLLEKVLDKKEKGKLLKYVRSWKKSEKVDGITTYNLQPMSKKYQKMKESLMGSYFVFNDKLLLKMEKEERKESKQPNKDDDDGALATVIENIEKEQLTKEIPDGTTDFLEIQGTDDVNKVLKEINVGCNVNWNSVYTATVYDVDYQSIIGSLTTIEGKKKLFIRGYPLVGMVEQYIQSLEEEE